MKVRVGNMDLNALLTMLQRRLWLAVAVGGGVFVVLACLAFFLPTVYSARALLLIEGQESSSGVGHSPEGMAMEARLGAISQDVLSNARLEKLVQDFQLDSQFSPQSLKDTIERIRKAIKLDITEDKREGVVTFSLRFSGTDPQQVTDIANALASFYVEPQSVLPQRKVSGVMTVPQAEIDQLRQRLEDRERQIQQYKDRYREELPEQLDANSKIVDRLRDRIQVITDALARKQERGVVLTSSSTIETKKPSSGFSALAALTNSIVTLRQELADLRTRYSEKHPDVERTKQELAALEKRLKFRTRGAGREQGGNSEFQLHSRDAESARLEEERKKLQPQLNEYQRRVDNTTKRTRELQALTRDYSALQEKYSSLIGRKETAKLASRPTNERVQILEPATFPLSPFGPRRVSLLLAALVLGVGAAFGSVCGWEKLIDTSFHSVNDLKNTTTIPVLVTIPRIAAGWAQPGRSHRRLVYLVACLFFLTVVAGAVHQLASNNIALALQLSSKLMGAHY